MTSKLIRFPSMYFNSFNTDQFSSIRDKWFKHSSSYFNIPFYFCSPTQLDTNIAPHILNWILFYGNVKMSQQVSDQYIYYVIITVKDDKYNIKVATEYESYNGNPVEDISTLYNLNKIKTKALLTLTDDPKVSLRKCLPSIQQSRQHILDQQNTIHYLYGGWSICFDSYDLPVPLHVILRQLDSKINSLCECGFKTASTGIYRNYKTTLCLHCGKSSSIMIQNPKDEYNRLLKYMYNPISNIDYRNIKSLLEEHHIDEK